MHDGTSWSTAFLTAQAGINSSVSGDELWVAKGTHFESITLNAGALYAGSSGTKAAGIRRD